jgi:HEAT repeat protein
VITEQEKDRSRIGYSERLETAVGIHPGERRLVGSVAALFALTQASQGLGANTADTLFFLRFGVEFLPIMILVSGPLAMIATLAYSAGLARVGAGRWLAPALSALAALLILERVGVTTDLPGIYAVIWLGAQVAILVSYTVMWNAAGEVCTTRQAKRLFPLFATAGIGGGIVGNALTGPLASSLGTENLLLVNAVLLLAASLVTATFVRQFFRTQVAVVKQSVVAELREGLNVTRGTPLLRLVAWSSIGFSILFFLVAFPFSEVVADTFQTEAEVAGYLGLFSAAATGVTFAVSLLGASRLFARIGVVATLSIVPFVYLAGFGLWLLSFGLATATVVRGAQWVTVNALGGTAWSSLFNVLPGRRRGQAMAFIGGFPAQLGTMASGALLLLGSALAPAWRAVMGLAVAIWVAMLVLKMRRAYTDALVHAVRHGMVEVFSAPIQGIQRPTLDAEALAVISTTLNDPQPGARAVAAGMLGRLDPERSRELVAKALADDEPRVRAAGLESIELQPASVALAQEMLQDNSPHVRRRAIQILARHGETLDATGAAVLADLDPEVRALAATLVDSGAGGPIIEHMLHSNDPRQLEAALDVLAKRPDLTRARPEVFAEHPDRRVRAAAARCMAGRADRLGILRQMLDDPSIRVRAAAANALAAASVTVPSLFEVLSTGSVRATEAAVRALTDAGLGADRLAQWVKGEVERAKYLRSHRMALVDGPSNPVREYLGRLLLMRQQRLERWALMAINAPEIRGAMPVVRKGVWSGDPETRAQALEALDSIPHSSVVRGLIALLEDDPAPGSGNGRTSLRALAQDFDEWIRALATRCLIEDLVTDFDFIRDAAAADRSGLVRAAMSRWTSPNMEDTPTLDTMDRVLALQRVHMFSDIDPEDLERVAFVTIERRYRPDESIYEEGAQADEMLVIVAGSVEVRHHDGNLIRTYGAGQHVGEMALLRGGTRVADVIAGAEGLHALALSAPELQAILEERPEVAMAMLATLADRLATM